MGKTLVLAEKPSVGKELARVLGCHQAKEGFKIGDQYIVTWALGHLVTLADPEFYGEHYKKWDLETLPMLPPKMELVVIKETYKQFRVVQTLLKSPEVTELVIATDAGREGELVARWIMEKAGFRKPVKRLWISSQTDKAIKEGFKNLHPARDYDNLYASAACRAEADWLVGLNVTRALTCKYNAQLSAGRVQTPTLAIIVQREEEIRNFSPKTYYGLTASLGNFTVTWQDRKSGQSRSFNQEKIEGLVKTLSGQQAKILEVKKEHKKEAPPLLYDLTELQRDANRCYGFSAKQTLNIMQRLYEQHKLLTYPRTDSRYLTTDLVPTLTERLKSIAISSYAPFARSIIRRGITPSKRFVDNSKVSDHHAIIPTEEYVDLNKLSSEEIKVYDLVVKRFLAALSPDFVYEQTTVKADIDGEWFTARGKTVQEKGWKAVYGSALADNGAGEDRYDGTGEDSLGEEGYGENGTKEQDDKEQILPEVKQGQFFKIQGLKLTSGRTKAPARYTEATLLSAMEHPGKFIDDESLRSVLDSANGIGTPATRADIIEKLFAVNYVERRGKEIFPLSKGIQLVEMVPSDLKSPELTAKWEERLEAISKGKEKRPEFIREIRDYASQLVGSVIASSATYRHDNLTRTPCPECGKFMLEVNGKKGKMLSCPDRECGHRENLSYLSNARCPNCHKKMEVSGEGSKRIYVCRCGFREKFDSFNKRLSANKPNVSKRDVEKYLRSQEKDGGQGGEAPSPFAQAWAEAQKKQ
jgi:DNA topoisomerase-3